MRYAHIALVLVASLAVACGDDSSGTPTQPNNPNNPPPAQTNRAPSITAMSITPFGIQSLSQFAFNGSATDPDGDSITYTWDVAGNPFSGSRDAHPGLPFVMDRQ